VSSILVEPARGIEKVGQQVDELLSLMSLEERIGRLSLANAGCSYIHDYLAEALRAGRVGSVLNEVDPGIVNELQRIAVEAARAGVDMEMDGDAYIAHLPALVRGGEIDEALVDAAVRRILDVKFGTWVFDGDPGLSVTPLQAIRELGAGRLELRCLRALETSRSRDTREFADAAVLAEQSDATILLLGEEVRK
jgi:hypothetical protein